MEDVLRQLQGGCAKWMRILVVYPIQFPLSVSRHPSVRELEHTRDTHPQSVAQAIVNLRASPDVVVVDGETVPHSIAHGIAYNCVSSHTIVIRNASDELRESLSAHYVQRVRVCAASTDQQLTEDGDVDIRDTWVGYSSGSFSPPASIPSIPQSQLALVLDLNGVLCDKVFDPRRNIQPWASHGRFQAFSVSKRPGLDAFLHWAQRRFQHVIIWSSLRYENVMGILHTILTRDLFDSLAPSIIGNESSPKDERFPDIRDGRNVAVLKDLSVLAERVRDFPGVHRTIICDDSSNKTRLNPERRIVPPAYVVHSVFDRAAHGDRGLETLRWALEAWIIFQQGLASA